MPTIEIDTIEADPGNRDWSLECSIAPGGSFQAVRDGATGTEGTVYSQVTVNRWVHGDWPYYYWRLDRSILWFDLSAYPVLPGIITSARIKFERWQPGSSPASDYANDSLLLLDDEGKVPTQADLDSSDYGKWKTNSTILGSIAGTVWAATQPAYLSLNAAGIAHLNWGGLTAFVLRTAKDVNNLTVPSQLTGKANYWYDGPSLPDHPVLIIEHTASPYRVFKGLFTRGDEIQAVFENSLGYRSPDFGITWHPMSGVPSTAEDIGFDILDEENSFIGADDELAVFDEAIGETFHYDTGATLSGLVSRIDVDPDSRIAVIGTDEFLYKTSDFGLTVYPWWEGNVTDVAIAGNFVVPSG